MANAKPLYVLNNGRFERTFIYRIVLDNPNDHDDRGRVVAFVEFEVPLDDASIKSFQETLRHAKQSLDLSVSDMEDCITEALRRFKKLSGINSAICQKLYMADIGFDI